MLWANKAIRGLICSALLASVGCCYHSQHFGKKRDIGIGEVGCSTCLHGPSSCEQGDCSQGACPPTMLPTKTSELSIGNSFVAMGVRDRSKTMVGRLREKIDGPKTERIELVLPRDTVHGARVVTTSTEPPAKFVSPSTNGQAKPLPAFVTVEAVAPPIVPLPAVTVAPEQANPVDRKQE